MAAALAAALDVLVISIAARVAATSRSLRVAVSPCQTAQIESPEKVVMTPPCALTIWIRRFIQGSGHDETCRCGQRAQGRAGRRRGALGAIRLDA